MKKTLVLVVDRDDDFGVKGRVETPVVGVERCSIAATALGIADPEDSDVNALYAAINIYLDMKSENLGEVEVALICGNEKVGHRSDAAIVDELETVLGDVSPDRVVLVGDGAEDEYIYPIVSSRVPIDSVKRVYVKQAPGLEGTVYIISKMLEDPAKRKRFLVPLGWVLILISLVYLIPPILGNISNGDSLYLATTPLMAFLIGALFILYAYNMQERFLKWKNKWVARVKRGSVTATFMLVSSLFAISGVIIGYFSLDGVYSPSIIQSTVLFASNALWPLLFAVLVYLVGDLLDVYFSTRTIKLSFIVGSINIMSIGLIITSILDFILASFDADVGNSFLYVGEFIFGVVMAFISAMVHRHIVAAIGQFGREKEENAV
ncbi:MAG: DUF373 family protein [Candidatus Methanoplasma sp.]|jgi:putative membrane protein|nr:DUF373 family protein [Candidatus Methanoplasma sp.]